jgi:hypothetical protein
VPPVWPPRVAPKALLLARHPSLNVHTEALLVSTAIWERLWLASRDGNEAHRLDTFRPSRHCHHSGRGTSRRLRDLRRFLTVIAVRNLRESKTLRDKLLSDAGAGGQPRYVRQNLGKSDRVVLSSPGWRPPVFRLVAACSPGGRGLGRQEDLTMSRSETHIWQ